MHENQDNGGFVGQQLPDFLKQKLTVLRLVSLIILLILASVYLIWMRYGMEVARLFVSVLTPLIVVALGYVFNRHLESYQVEREKRRAEIERRHKAHIEFTIDANVYGPMEGSYLIEFLIYAHNKSLVRHEFEEIPLRVLGLEDEEPTFWEKSEYRLKFPDRLIKTDIVPKFENSHTDDGRDFVFVEPDVKQPITFVTKIGEKYEYILARAEFTYGDSDLGPHSTERMFALHSTDDS